MKILSNTEKELLQLIVSNKREDYSSYISCNDLPEYINTQLKLLLNNLKNYGYCATFEIWIGGTARVILTPEGINYIEKEEEYKKSINIPSIKIDNYISNNGIVFLGNVYDPKFRIDNSIVEIEKVISEHGGEDTEELKQILLDVKAYLENIENGKNISSNKKLFSKIGDHLQKHQWFYQTIVEMLGTALLSKMGGN